MKRFVLALALTTLAPLHALAQTPAASPPAAPPFTAGWQDGFVIQTPNGDTRLVFGLTAQMDGRFSLDDPTSSVDTFTIRKARPTFSGRVGKYFDFRVMPDFGNSVATLFDAYFDIRFSPKLRVRTGKDKTPIGYEVLICDGCLPFPERSLASGLVPSRDTGVQAQGDLIGGKVSYAVGVFNGIPDGTNAVLDLDANGGKDLAGRIIARSASGLGVHLGASTGTQTGALPVFRTSVGQTYFAYLSGVAAEGRRTRVTPAVFYYHKAFGGFAEFVQSSQEVARSGVVTDLGNRGWDVSASYILTGEASSERIVRPTNPFDPAAGHWGAVQILARYSALSVDPLAFTNGLAASGSSPGAKQATIAVNWYPVACIKYYLTFERTTFDEQAGAVRPNENVILFRAQIAF